MAAVRDALSVAVLAGMGLVVFLGLIGCVPSRRQARERALREDLVCLRMAIDQYKGDHGGGPESLESLVRAGYLRRIPADPITGSSLSWIEVRIVGCPRATVTNVRSGAPGKGLDGTFYRSW